MLEVKNLQVYYGLNEAVHGVRFSVKQGQIVSLIGSNGAGKTSTLNAIIGTLKRKGEVLYNAKNIIKAKTHSIVRSGIALVPEGRRVFINLSVEENIKIGAFNNMDSFEEMLEKSYKLFPRLEHKRKALAGTLSGGEAQMLAIVRALMSKPKLLMLDEPSLGLAPKVVGEVFAALKELNEKGLSILLVEQNAFLALKSSDYTYVLENGHISLEGTSSSLVGDDEIRRKYLGA